MKDMLVWDASTRERPDEQENQFRTDIELGVRPAHKMLPFLFSH